MGLMAASSKPNFKNTNTLEVEESEEEKQICEEYHDSIINRDKDNLEDYLDMHCGVKWYNDLIFQIKESKSAIYYFYQYSYCSVDN